MPQVLPPPGMEGFEQQIQGLRWDGLEQALRNKLIEEGVEPVWLEAERKEREAEIARRERAKGPDPRFVPDCNLETAEEFSRTFTEAALGLALNEGGKGRIVVKRILPGSAAASRRIPQGGVVSVVAINGRSTDGKSLKQVQKLIKTAERPVKIDFEQPPPPEPTGEERPKGTWNAAKQRFEQEGEQAEPQVLRAGIDF